MKLEMSEYHDNNWFLGSRKVYEPLVTISGGKIYQTFLHVGYWTWTRNKHNGTWLRNFTIYSHI